MFPGPNADADTLLDLDISTLLDADPIPTFLVNTHTSNPVPFEIIFCNKAFHGKENLQAKIEAENDNSCRFRTWAQAIAYWREEYEFADMMWSAFKVLGVYKVIRAAEYPVCVQKATPEVQDISVRLNDVKMLDARIESLQKMMEMSDVGVFEYDPAGKLIQANNSWYKLSSHPREGEAHQDFSFMDLVYPPDIPLVISMWNTLVGGNPVTFEMRWKAKGTDTSSGELIDTTQWVLSACVPVLDTDGNVVSIAGNTIDINAQKRSQEEALQRAETLEKLRASENRFARFAESAPVAIVIYNTNRVLQYCNDQFFELTGHPRAAYEEIQTEQLVLPEDAHIIEESWKTLLEDKIPTQVQYRLRRKWVGADGIVNQAWAQGQSHPELNPDGSVRSIMATISDISQWKWAENVQRVRVEEALEAKRQQENFIDMTSHEMRNPLSAVVQCADSTIESLTRISAKNANDFPAGLQDDFRREQEEIKGCLDALQTIISCSLHQKRIIDDILTLSKLDSNLILITPIRVQPVAVVTEAIKMFELECSKDHISLIFHEDPSLAETGARWVMLDPSRVLQVLINLLTNAIKFTRDRPTREIVVTLGACLTRPPPSWNKGVSFAGCRISQTDIMSAPEWGTGERAFLWIKVDDTGCGLSISEQANLFTRFSQATPRTHVRYGGSGLGLFISKSLTELQGGAIGVCSESEVGSTFAFYVGTRLATPEVIEPQHRPSRDGGAPQSLGESLKVAHYTVLIVEDNLVNQKVLSKQLQKAGCIVYVAGHGAEALTFLQGTNYWQGQELTGKGLDIILMDIEMPVMDGLTCSRKIREAQKNGNVLKHVPILAVSANARSEQMKQAKEAGVDDAISKPFRVPELLTKIETVLRCNN